MFAEGSMDNEHITVVGDEGKLESLLPSLQLRHSRREDWVRRAAWGQPSGTGRGVPVRRVWDTNIRYPGQHFGASFIEHQQLREAPCAKACRPRSRWKKACAASSPAWPAHRSIETGLPVQLSELLPPGW